MPEVVPPPNRGAQQRRRLGLALAGLVGLALVGAPLVAAPASANPAGSELVISEVYARGGSAGATYKNRFIELFNPTGADIALAGTSIQYRSPTGTANPSTTIPLVGTVPAGGHFLIQGASNAANGADLPTPDQVTSINFGAAGGTLFLVDGTSTLLAPPTGSITANDAIIDLVGYGTSNTFEGSVAAAPTFTESIARAATGADTDANGADFTIGAMTPESTGGGGTPTPTPTPTPTATPTPTPTDTPTVTISEIQGTGDASPLVGRTVTTSGVVTARYPSGGYNGYVIQTPGTGGAIDFATHTASDAVFVYSSASVGSVAIGDYVQITGAVSEFNGLTELTPTSATTVVQLPAAAAPTPATVAFPRESAQRESLESMLIAPQGDYTITDTYDLNSYGSIGLATGASPLLTPTEVARPGTAAYTAAVADNAARGVILDDGASINFLGSSANKAIPLPYLTIDDPVRVGAAATFTAPVVLDYRNNAWAFQPTQQLTAANAGTVQPAIFENTREAAPEAVGGDIAIASFNVLNYFPTTGDSLTGCSYYTDRDGNPVTVNSGCDARGAANADDLERQQAKIVTAINSLGASVVSLEEIENSATFGKPRDFALATLTDALNAAAGSEVWAYVPSPSVLPALANEDVIRTAFIYKKATVEPVGESVILDNNVAFSNARKPLAQEFRLIGDASSEFLAIVNHFKSKGSGSGADADQNDGQGASNASRVAQANALVAFAEQLETEKATDLVYLLGDFNAYTQEDPIRVLVDAGFVDQGSKDGKYSYSFDGAVGSLDHVFASAAGDAKVTGVDTWNINSGESVALEYSRYNYNATLFYDTSAYRSSDHDPVVVGLALAADTDAVTALRSLGSAQTVETGSAVAARSAEARKADGSLAAGAEVTFTIDGPASFVGGGFTATAVSNAAGIATTPAITAGPLAGAVTITAAAGSATATLPSVTVVEPATSIDVATSASTSIVSGKVVLTVTATNNGDEPVQIVITTKYGSKKTVGVAAGATVSYAAKTYLASIPAGTASVVVTAADGSQLTYPTPYAASAN